MAFKLGSNRGSRDNKLNIGSRETISGCRIERVELPEGVMGESHKEGVIYISNAIDPDSEQYRRVLNHEMKHMTHMKLGRVDYTDEYVFWDGVEYPRQQGYVLYENQWVEEGDVDLPWEFKD